MKKVPFNLSSKTAIITGGASGIGRSIATIFARQGANVMILDVNKKSGEEVAKAITEEGHQAIFKACDITDQKEVDSLFKSLHQQFHSIDIVINNAAISHIGTVENTHSEDFDRLYQVNVKGCYHILQAAVHHMKKSKGGVILNMASIASVIGLKDRFAYSMSKGALLTMTYSVARDFLDSNIRCNAIGPARVHTPFVDDFLAKNYPNEEKEMYEKLAKIQPIGRMGTPEEIAYLALYLCSDEAAFVTGSFYPIDGGFLTLNG
ncbi:MAG: SDR family oxidoreductase [Bacteroidota bacterium]